MKPSPPPVDESTIGERDLAEWRSTPGRALATAAVKVGAAAARSAPATASGPVRLARPEWWVALVTAVIGVLVAVILTATASEVYEEVAEDGNGATTVDVEAWQWGRDLRGPIQDDVFTAISFAGGAIGLSVTAAALAVLLAWRRRSWTPPVLIGVAAAGSLAMTLVGKYMIGRVRPPHEFAVPPLEHSPAFPSGHTLNTTTFVLVAIYLLWMGIDGRRGRGVVAAVGVLFIVLVGVSRVFLGHHWLSDVTAGWALGAAWATVVVTVHRIFLTVRRARSARSRPISLEGDAQR